MWYNNILIYFRISRKKVLIFHHCVRGLQRTNWGYRNLYIAHGYGSGRFEILRASQQVGHSVKSWFCGSWVQNLQGRPEKGCKLRPYFHVFVLRSNSFYKKRQSLLLRPSTDCLRLIHIMEGNMHYSKSTDLSVNHI